MNDGRRRLEDDDGQTTRDEWVDEWANGGVTYEQQHCRC